MNASEPRLDTALAALREATAGENPPASTDRAIALAIERAAKARRDPAERTLAARLRRLFWPALAFGAVASLVAALALQPGTHRGPDVTTVARGDDGAMEAARSFLPLVPVAEIERSGEAWVVPARIPRIALAQYGLPIDPARADGAVSTELLLRRDGAVLAIRLAQ